jgi:hypothetical protein
VSHAVLFCASSVKRGFALLRLSRSTLLLKIVSVLLLPSILAWSQICYQFSGHQIAGTGTIPDTFVATVNIADIPPSTAGGGFGFVYGASFSSVINAPPMAYSPKNVVTIAFGQKTYTFNFFGVVIYYNTPGSSGGTQVRISGSQFPPGRGSSFAINLTGPTGPNAPNLFPTGLTRSLPPITAWNHSVAGAIAAGFISAQIPGPNGAHLGGEVESIGSACRVLCDGGQPCPSCVRFGSEIAAAAITFDVDPTVLAAIAAQETGGPDTDSGNNVIGDDGHGYGIFQIDDRSHADFTSTPGAMNPAENAAYAASMISQLIEKYDGDEHAALSAYNAGLPDRCGTRTFWKSLQKTLCYADSVLAHKARLQADGMRINCQAQ